MHIKHMHEMVEKLAEYGKCAVEAGAGAGKADLKEVGEIIDMVKDLSEAEYYARISKAMEEAEEDEGRDRMFYRGQPRRMNGQYKSRSGYTPYYHVPPEFQHDMNGSMYDTPDRMYFTGQVGGNMGSRTASNYMASQGTGMSGEMRGREVRPSKHGYSHDEYMHKMKQYGSESPEEKKKRKETFLERVNDLGEMLSEEMEEMTAEERQAWRGRLNKLING